LPSVLAGFPATARPLPDEWLHVTVQPNQPTSPARTPLARFPLTTASTEVLA
jgi:hypothetical protein